MLTRQAVIWTVELTSFSLEPSVGCLSQNLKLAGGQAMASGENRNPVAGLRG